jgi:hypothetical protein
VPRLTRSLIVRKVISGRDWGRLKMLEYLAYAAFLIAVFGCLVYVMNSLETEGPSEGPP